MFAPRQAPQQAYLNTKQRIVVVLVNVLLLAELTFSMYRGQQDPENLSAIFIRTFLPLAGVTLVAGRLLMRRLSRWVKPNG